MKKIKFEICGKKWTLKILSQKKYDKKRGNDSIAITHFNKRKIEISPAGLDRETFEHELIHAYLAEFCIKSTDLDDDNLEEVFCELFSKRGREIRKLAKELLDKAKGIEEPPHMLPLGIPNETL